MSPSCSKPRAPKCSIVHRSLAICTTTKYILTILLGNEGDSDCGLSCVHSVRRPSAAVKVTATGRRNQREKPTLTPSAWRAGGDAGSLYRSPPRWLIRLILLIESHPPLPSPTVPLWDWGQTERLRASRSGMASRWTATVYQINQRLPRLFSRRLSPPPSPPCLSLAGATPPLLLFADALRWMTADPHRQPWEQSA